MCAALFSYVWRHGKQGHGADDCPGESCSSRGVVARPVPEQEQLRGWWWWLAVRPSFADRLEAVVHGGSYEVQRRSWRRPIPVRSNSARSVVAVRGVALQ
jgi:hypothetical protein